MIETAQRMRLEASWHQVLKEVIETPIIQELKKFLEEEKQNGFTVFPPEELIFNAFRYTHYDAVNVVIVGQDPYHNDRQAMGLSFSVPEDVNPPPSLKNIFKEISQDVGIDMPTKGCLIPWAKQGVLLLNATLTVRKNSPMSHHGKGWEFFTDAVIEKILQKKDPVVFVLWGKSAQEKFQKFFMEKPTHHAVLTAPHPSPYSAHNGFFGCRHFSKINQFLVSWGKAPIDWRLP